MFASISSPLFVLSKEESYHWSQAAAGNVLLGHRAKRGAQLGRRGALEEDNGMKNRPRELEAEEVGRPVS